MTMDEGVSAIFQAYPRHKDKRYAEYAIEKAIQRIMSGDTGHKMSQEEAIKYLLGKVSKFSQSPAGTKGVMTPFPATWMNRGSYLDDEKEWYATEPQAESLAERNKRAFDKLARRSQ